MAQKLLKEIFNENKWGIIFTYCLTISEIILESCIPYMLGLSIDDLLCKKYFSLAYFIIPFLLVVIIGTFRRKYDTRVFSTIYKNKATKTIAQLKKIQLDKKKISIRYGLVGVYSDFFEHTLPNTVKIVLCIIISLIMIAFIQISLLIALLPFLIIIFLVHRNYGHSTQKVEYSLQKTREDISHSLIDDMDCGELLEQQKNLFIHKSDLEATNFFVSDSLALIAQVICILIITSSGITIGEITSVFMYCERVVYNGCNGFILYANFKLIEMTDDLLAKNPED